MISVVKVKYDEIASGLPASLFRSVVAGIADGEQARDFIWVGDVVDVMLWLLDTPEVCGIFNVGTGISRSYLDLAYAVSDAAGVPRSVEFIEMPQVLKPQYQSFTQARIERLRGAGYAKEFTTLEHGIGRYVRDYLSQPNPYR
jgi:ADP-L-glycero-D-manno-heptose 6-epimerase